MSCGFSGKAVLFSILLSITITFFSPPGFAYQKGDILVRAGIGLIDPREDSDSINLGGTELGELGVESTTIPVVNVSYFMSDHLAFDLLLGKPPDVDIVGATGLLKGLPIGNIEAYPLVVTAHYYPLDSHSRWQPFVGIGFNYVVPGDTEVNQDLAPLFGAERVEIDVEDSWGLALSLGVDFMVLEKVILSAEAYYMDVEGKANGKIIIDDQAFNVDMFARTSYAPVLYTVTIGYVF